MGGRDEHGLLEPQHFLAKINVLKVKVAAISQRTVDPIL